MGNIKHELSLLYQHQTSLCQRIDDLYSEVLTKHYGKNACDMRYRPDLQSQECRGIGEQKRSLDEARRLTWLVMLNY